MKTVSELYEDVVNEAKKIEIDGFAITQKDIDKSKESVIVNHKGADDGTAMKADDIIGKDNDGNKIKLTVIFNMKKGEEQDNTSIYDLDRVLDIYPSE